MNKNDILNLLRQGILAIAFDTNALFGDKRFKRLCTSINRINRLDDKYQLKLVVPAPAHAEKLRQIKQHLKKQDKKYSHEFVLKNLTDLGIHIAPFEPWHAEKVADLFHKQFPTEDDWNQYKLKRCLDCIGINCLKRCLDCLELSFVEEFIESTGQTCSATVDWLIAGYAYAENCLLVTDDTGKEFKGIEKKTTFDELEAAVNQLLQALCAL
jgi:hypothetical protein